MDFDDFFDSPRAETSSKQETRFDKSAARDRHGSTTHTPGDNSDSDDYDRGKSNKAVKKKTIHADVPYVNVGNNSDSDHGESSGRKAPSPRQAKRYSSNDSDSNSDEDRKLNGVGKTAARPKTAKANGSRRQRQRSQPDSDHSRSRSRSRSPKAKGRKNGGDNHCHSDSESDSYTGSDTESSYSDASDITDVSPLNSLISPKDTPSKKKVQIGDATTYSSSRPPKSPFTKDRPKSGRSSGRSSSSNYDHILEPDKDTMNLKLLMQAIMEMEGERSGRYSKASNRSFSSARLFQAPKSASAADRKNMSFRNDQIKEIDRENQRLMKEILNYATTVKKQKRQKKVQQPEQPVTVAHRLTPSAVNRLKEQKRIEHENQVFKDRYI